MYEYNSKLQHKQRELQPTDDSKKSLEVYEKS
jgi:hypothetical protein